MIYLRGGAHAKLKINGFVNTELIKCDIIKVQTAVCKVFEMNIIKSNS